MPAKLRTGHLVYSLDRTHPLQFWPPGCAPTRGTGGVTSDALDRLTAASSNQNWGTAYVYDGFENLLQKNVTAGSAPSLMQSVNTATNQIDYVNYDANGNQTTLYGAPAAYDAQSRMIQRNGWNHYAYNASKQRVWRLWAQRRTDAHYALNAPIS